MPRARWLKHQIRKPFLCGCAVQKCAVRTPGPPSGCRGRRFPVSSPFLPCRLLRTVFSHGGDGERALCLVVDINPAMRSY